MNLGIIGSGNVGGTLGSRWAALGHAVVFGSRDPGGAPMRELLARAGANARAASVAEAAAASDVVLLATPWPATQSVLAGLPLSGKVLIDATNPLLANLHGLEYGTTTSGAENVEQWAPGARVVKAFNTVGFKVMANPVFDGRAAAMFLCGDDGESKETVQELARAIGFDARDAGGLRQARLLEPCALLWISLAIEQGYGLEFGFSVMKR
ncbi:MAG: NADPH-dependent F420 reductase [Bryobacteraceae bacterium]